MYICQTFRLVKYSEVSSLMGACDVSMLRVVLPRSLKSALVSTKFRPSKRLYQSSGPSFKTLEEYLLQSGSDSKPLNPSTAQSNQGLSRLRNIIETGDIASIIQNFDKFLNTQSPDELGGNDWEALSQRLHRHISKLPSTRRVAREVQEMALQAATKGHVDGFRTLMILHLTQGDGEGVLSLYDQFHERFLQDLKLEDEDTGANDELSSEQNKMNSDPDLDLATDDVAVLDLDSSEGNPHPEAIADLLIASVAAAAMENNFDAAFDRVMATPSWVRIAKPRVEAFCLTHLQYSQMLTERVVKWCQDLANCRLLSRVQSLTRYLSQMAKQKQIKGIEGLAWRVLVECKRPDGTMEVSDTLPVNVNTTPRKLPISSLNVAPLIRAFGRCARMDFAEQFWSELTTLGLIPNHQLWTALVDAYGRNGRIPEAEATWRKMLEAGIEPSRYAYGILINAYFYAGHPDKAFALFRQFRMHLESTAEGRKTLRDDSMIGIYNLVMRGLCKSGRDDKANDIMRDILQNGPKPDIVSYNIFLAWYARQGDMKNVAIVLKSMEPAGLKPDVVSFTTVLSVLYKTGKQDAHVRLLKAMDRMNLGQDAVMYTAILDWLVRHEDIDMVRDAISLLQHMETDSKGDVRPTEVTYTALLAGILRNPSIPQTMSQVYATEVLQRMRQRDIYPNRVTYHYLIKACLDNPSAESLQMALNFYHEMLNRGFQIANRTWFVLLDGLYHRGDASMAAQLVEDMFHKKVVLDNPLAALVEKINKHR